MQDGYASETEILPLLHELSQELKESIKSRKWFSTQENYHLVNASLVQGLLSKDQKLKFSLNGADFTKDGHFSQQTGTDVTLTNSSAQPLHLEFLAYGYPKEITKAESTIPYKGVKRRYWTPDGHYRRGNTPFKVGERVIVELLVELSEPVPDALLVEMIPAGMVLENPSLNQGIDLGSVQLQFNTSKRTINSRISRAAHTSYRNDRFVASLALERGRIYRFYYMLRAEVPGQYQTAPLYLESMYRPDKRIMLEPEVKQIEVLAQ